MQPLVTRPPYGDGQPRMPRAESGLPGGGPSDKGVSLDPDTPGTSTFAKPVEDVREFDKAEEGSIYRKDGPDDRAKEQDDPGEDRRQNDWLVLRHAPPGGRPKDDKGITPYPYRDGIPNAHNASAEFIVGMWHLRMACDLWLPAGCRVAATLDTMVRGLNPDVARRGQACNVSLKRADTQNLRWFFSVDCGNGAKVVRMKAVRQGNVIQFNKLDLHTACSCPAWRWQGPEYHATRRDYQDPKTPLQGTASAPNVRDPQRINKVCKHVAAVLSFTERWTIPTSKKRK